MGCGFSSGIKENEQKSPKQKTSTIPKEPKEPKQKIIPFSYYCFTEEEKSYIEELKEKGVEKDDEEEEYSDEGKSNFKNLFTKIEMDLKGDKSTYKEYHVLHLNDNFDTNKSNTIKIDIYLKYNEQKFHQRYLKKNGVKLNSYLFNSNEDESCFNIDCDLSEEDYKRKIIIIEACLDMEINLFYGLIMGFISFSKNNGSALFHYDKNYKVGNIFTDGLKRVSDNEVYGMKFDSSFFCFRDIRANYNIIDELGDLVKSKFNKEEIDQINFSLNNVLSLGTGKVIIYKKMVYNLIPEKVEVTGYSIFLEKEPYEDRFSSEGEKDYIINEIKINNNIIPKVEYDESLEDNYGGIWFYSSKERTGVSLHFEGHVFLKEFKVEIPYCEKCSLTEVYDIGSRLDYGTSYKYEIINSGVDLPMKQFDIYNYLGKDGKIIFAGYYNIHQKDYNDEKYMRNNKNAPEKLGDRISEWEKINEKKLYPLEFVFSRK